MAYTPYNFDFTPTYLNSLSNSLNTLQKRHDATIEGASKLKEAIAKLPLNAAEEGYRQDLLNKIEITLDSDTIGGFGGFGYDNIVKLSGDIASDEGLLGRLRAQESYQKFQDLTDNRNDIDQDTKDYIKEVNQYNFDPSTNGDWKPTYAGVKQYTMDEIYKLAMNYVTPKTGTISSIKYMDKDGNIVDTYDKNNVLGYYSNLTNTFEKVTEDMLNEGIKAAMQVTPGIRASLEQDLKVGLWKDAKNKDNKDYIKNDLLYYGDGTSKSLDDYITDITTPFLRSKAYYREGTPHIKFNDSLITAYAKHEIGSSDKNGNQKDNPYLSNSSPKGMPAFKIAVKDKSISKAQNNIVDTNDTFRESIVNSQFFKDIPIDVSKIQFTDPRATREYLLSILPNLSEGSVNFINDTYDKMKYQAAINADDIYVYNNTLENKQKYASEISLYNAITNGIDLKVHDLGIDKLLLYKYGYIMNDIFNNGSISHNIKNKDEYDIVCEKLKVNAPKSPFKGGEINGEYYISLDKENSNYFYQFKDAIDNLVTKGNKWGYFDGNRILRHKFHHYNYNTIVKAFGDFYKSLHNDQIVGENDDNTQLIDATLYPGQNYEESIMRAEIANSATDQKIRNEYKDIIKEDTKTFAELIAGGANFTELEIFKPDGKGSYKYADNNERMALSNYIIGTNVDDIIINNIVTEEGKNLPVITLPGIEKNNKTIREPMQFVIGGLGNYNDKIREFEENSSVKALSEIDKLVYSNSQLTFATIKDPSGNYINYNLRYAGKDSYGQKQFMVNVNGKDQITINIDEALALREIYNDIMKHSGIGYINEDALSIPLKQYTLPLQKIIESIFGMNIFNKSYEDGILDMLGG